VSLSRANLGPSPSLRADRKTITDDKGNFRLENMSPGIWTVKVDAEGYEPLRKDIEIKQGSAENFLKLEANEISEGYIKLQNDKLRGRIRSSTSSHDVDICIKESEHLIKLASRDLKRFATNEFSELSKRAERKLDDLRKLESSTAIGVGPFKVIRSVKKQEK
jgi:hypothetical protein